MSFINDSLLQPMLGLHVNNPLLQFTNVMDPFLSSSALFFKFYSHAIQTLAF